MKSQTPVHAPRLALRLALSTLLIVLSLPGKAASPDLLLTAATTARDAQGQDIAYLVLTPPSPDFLRGHVLAVYSKVGAPDSLSPFVQRALLPPPAQPASLDAILSEAAKMNVDLSPLPEALAGLGAPAGQPLAQQLATILGKAASQPQTAQLLDLLARQHPAIGLAMGRAWSGAIVAGTTTFEIREAHPITRIDLGVVARLTVVAGFHPPLPSPGGPVQVHDLTPTGDQRIKLRWAASPELRRRSPLQQGFNLWRLPKALAQTRGWLAQAPSVDALIAGSQRVNSGAIQPAMNLSEVEAQDLSSPVYLYADDNGRAQDPARAFADGAEFAYFVTARDILGRDGLPSPAGLATACRTLGPAIPSGLKVSNQHAFTDKEAGDDSQWLRVEWIPNPGGQRAVPTRYEIFRGLDLSELEAADGPPLAHRVASVPHAATGSLSYDDRSLAPKENFYGRTFWYAGRAVYEGPCGAIYSPLSPPIFGSLRKATAPPAPSGSVEGNCPFPMAAWSVNRLSDAESVANDGQVHFRAECHRRGPGVLWAEFSVFLPRSKREIRLDRVFFPADLDVVSAVYTLSPQEADTPFQLSCAVASAEGAASNAADRPVASILRPPAGRLTIDRFEAAELTTWDLRPDDPLTAPLLSGQVCFSPVSARDDGAVLIQSPQLGNGLAVLFAVEQGHSPRALGTFRADAGSIALTDAEVNARNADNLPWQYCGYLVSPNLAGLSDCPHLARADGGSRVHHPHVRVRLTPDARQYRIFRRVDAGPLELIAQGRVDGSQTPSITRDDDAQPPRGAQICYYAQLLDANGNVSPMSLLGCLTHTADLPTPVLASPETDGDYADPRVKLQWFCDPAGVERFEVFLVSVAGKVDLDQLLVETSGTLIPWPPAPSSIFNARALHTVKDVKSGDSSSAAAEQSFLTGKVGGDFGEGPQFTLNLRIQPTKTYDVWVKAVGPTGRRGGQSYKQRFVWRPPPPPRSKAPWPARPLPPRVEFHPGIAAASHLSCQSDADAPQVGVRIGAMPLSADASCGNGRPGPVILAKAPATDVGLYDPNRWVFTDSASSPPRTNVTLLPAILYREQIPNAAFPRVKGDLAQVSPLVQKIAWNPIPFARDASIASLVDPFIGVKANPNFGLFNLPSALELFILDTHPLLSGAKYRYWLLHYGPNGEPESTIPAGEIQIP